MTRVDGTTHTLGVPVGTQLVALYAPGGDVNLIQGIASGDLPTVHTAYAASGVSGYTNFDEHGWFGAHVGAASDPDTTPQDPNVKNAWDGGLAVFSDGSVAQVQKVRTVTEKDYIYFTNFVGIDSRHGDTQVTGTAAPGATVELFAGGAKVATVTAEGNGVWSAGIQGLPDGPTRSTPSSAAKPCRLRCSTSPGRW